jgi:hypothetical protein
MMLQWIHRRCILCTIGSSDVLGFAGPLDLFHLSRPRAPYVSLFSSFSPCEPPRSDSRSTARTPPPRQCSPLLAAAAASPLRRRSATARAQHQCSRATPAPRLHSPCHAHAAPVPPTRRHSPPPTVSLLSRILSYSELPPTRVHSSLILVPSTLGPSARKVFEELPLRLLRFLLDRFSD